MTTSRAHAPRHWVPEWEFGDRVRKVRTSMGLGQVEFAEHLGLKAPTLAAYETGRASPRSRDLPALASRLELFTGVPREWFLGWEIGPIETEKAPTPKGEGMEPPAGLDPATYALQGDRTAEIIPLFQAA